MEGDDEKSKESKKWKFLKVVGDGLGTLVGVQMAPQKKQFRPGYDQKIVFS